MLSARHRWVCPNCSATDVTSEAAPHTRFHACAGLGGITAPMVEAGVDCKVEAMVREDYIGPSNECHMDEDGQPISAVVVTRDEGNDCAVLAPCAIGRING